MTDPLTVLREAAAGWPQPNKIDDAVADIEALVEAARVVNGDGVGEFDTRTLSALLPLRAALAPFTNNTP